MRYALTFLLMATIALGQGVWPKTATVVDGGHRYDFDTLGKRSVTPSADYGNIVLWQAFSYSDNSDADFYDLSTSGNDGAQGTAASQPVFSSGVGGHYIYDGIDDFVTFGTPALGTADYTLSAWGYLESGTTRPFVTENDISSPTSTGFEFPMVSIAASSIAIQRSALGSYSGTISISTNEWHFVTFSRTSGTMAGYLDGAVVSLSGGGSAYDQNGYDFTGTEFFSSKLLFNTATIYKDGRHDDLRVYSTALTAAEILAIADNTGATYYPYFSGFTESFDTYSDLALWMPFTSDETPDYIDKGPIGNDGSQTTAASQPTWSSADGGVYDFDGVDDFITMDVLDMTGFTEMTFACWVNPRAAGTAREMFNSKWTTGQDLRLLITGADAFNARWDDGVDDGVAFGIVQTNQWTFFAATQSNGDDEIRGYINGALAATDTSSNFDYSGLDGETKLGQRAQDSSRSFNGLYDDARVYDSALTAAQILAIADNTGATYYPYFSGFTESFDTYSDLALWMPFTSDETPDYIDKGPIGNDGSQTTAASQPTWSSADGGVYDFDGVDDYIGISDAPFDFAGAEATLTGWFKIENSGTRMMLIAKQNSGDQQYVVERETGDTIYAAFVTASGQPVISFRTTENYTNGWHLFSFSFDTDTAAESAQLYIDGAATGVENDNSATYNYNTTGAGTLKIGARFATPQDFLDGLIDDVRIYDTALTAAQILAIYNNTKGTYGL